MSQNYWTDPAGQRRNYATQGRMSLGTRGKRAIERDRVWSGVDPTFDPSEFSVLPSGQIREQEGFPWGYALMAASAPLAGMFLPAAFGGGGAAGATGGGVGAGALSGLKGFLTDPDTYTGLAGVIAALSGGRGGANNANAERLNALTEQRMRRVDPLHQAITQLAWNRLPTNARQGIAPPTYSPLG